MADTEPDDKAEQGGEGSAEPKPEKRIITLVNGEQTVIMEGPDDLQTMAELAAYFWLLTSPPEKVTLGFSAGSSLVTERAEPYYEDRGTTDADNKMG